ncbi:hypothetical protein Fcan01_16162 [Folsomia candida]|uniref:Uncharacterized protein n=1 Tax=Folsomia candida TaxID=158441 RepID=A0A226DXI5_FOLCA|nr:hypothetical protein Fcan01_16162 [Folsomia candida]
MHVAPLKVELGDYLTPFENCTAIVMMPENRTIRFSKLSKNPIVLTNKTCDDTAKFELLFSIQRRRNPSRHCWALFAVYPEADYLITYEQDRNNRAFIRETVNHQYLILLTSFKSAIQHSLKNNLRFLMEIGRREVIVVDILLDGQGTLRPVPYDGRLRLEYHNVNHDPNILMDDGKPSIPWYPIECLNYDRADCFEKVTSIGKATANLNKHLLEIREAISFDPSKKPIVCHIPVKSRQIYQKLSDSRRFTEFIGHLLVSDSCHNASARYTTPVISNVATQLSFTTPIIESVRDYGFISCYMVKPDTFILSALSDPFDMETWISLCVGFTVFVAILTILPGQLGWAGMLFATGICLENSVLDGENLFRSRFPSKSDIQGVRILIAVWVVLTGTTLTNWYKTSFTMDMIVPVKYDPPWDTFLDIEGAQVLMPFDLLDETGLLAIGYFGKFRHLTFLNHVLLRVDPFVNYQGNYSVFKGYARMAQLLKGIIPLFEFSIPALQAQGTTLKAYTTKQESMYLNISQQQSPIKPIDYNETDRLVKTLATCVKVAFLDTKENIASILPFLNDNQYNVKYLHGEDSFFRVTRGWEIFPIRENYAEKRLKILLSSGIYLHWKSWFRLVKPPKLFHHYANWTYPRFDKGSQLDYNSKIVTGFYASGICLVGCILCFAFEVWIVSRVKVLTKLKLSLNSTSEKLLNR